ncbi:hypothetical protein D3C81_1901190 [compost metagenome]
MTKNTAPSLTNSVMSASPCSDSILNASTISGCANGDRTAFIVPRMFFLSFSSCSFQTLTKNRCDWMNKR